MLAHSFDRFDSNGQKINIGLRQSIQDELKSINKRQPVFFANIFMSLAYGNGQKINIGLRQTIQDELKSINKRQPVFFANIIMSLGVLSMNGTPLAPLILG